MSAICNGQQKQTDTAVKFTPTVIVKDDSPEIKSKEEVKFTPPVIEKNKPSKGRKSRGKEAVKFTPPVIVKDHGKR